MQARNKEYEIGNMGSCKRKEECSGYESGVHFATADERMTTLKRSTLEEQA